MNLNGNPYGAPRPVPPPLSRKDKIQFWLGFVILGIGLPYLVLTLCQIIRDTFLWLIGA